MRAPLKTGRVERHAVGDVVRPDHLDHERLPRRHVDRVDQAEQEGQHEDVPYHDDVEVDQPAEDQGQEAGGRLSSDDRPPLRPDVRDDPSEQSQNEDRHELHGAEEARGRRSLLSADQRDQKPPLSDRLASTSR